MNVSLYGSICLSDIPRDLIRTSEKNGKKYLTICINEKKEADEYGNTHYIKVYNRNKEAKPVYLGDMKLTQPTSGAQQGNAPSGAQNAAEGKNEENKDGLPF